MPTTTRLPRSFYARPTPLVARDLLGRQLVRRFQGQRLAGLIVEAEAYTGNDEASHAHRGRTPRNRAMFGPPGGAYVYFIYGMHWMFNVVAHQRPPGAVLIRALAPREGLDLMRAHRGGRPERLLTNGPARLAQALAILPGISRSGATISIALIRGISGEEAATFSFLLAIPTLGAATVYDLLKNGRALLEAPSGAALLLFGMIIAFAVALLVIAAFLRYLGRYGLAPFGVYRVLLGALVLFLAARGSISDPGAPAASVASDAPAAR